jgi:hypothetical protein
MSLLRVAVVLRCGLLPANAQNGGGFGYSIRTYGTPLERG